MEMITEEKAEEGPPYPMSESHLTISLSQILPLHSSVWTLLDCHSFTQTASPQHSSPSLLHQRTSGLVTPDYTPYRRINSNFNGDDIGSL